MNNNQLGEKRMEYAKPILDASGDVPARTLAKELHAARPDLWKSIEAARTFVRTKFGTHGTQRRKSKITTTNKRKPRKAGECPKAYIATPRDRHIKQGIKWFVCGDIHAPYHSEQAIEIAKKEASKRGCQGIYINGDFADNAEFSRHFKTASCGDLQETLDLTQQVLAWLCDGFDPIVIKLGNHDEWYQRWILNHADSSKLSVVAKRLEDLLGFDEIGVSDIVKQNQLAFLETMPIIHGHEIRGSGGVNPARWAFLKTGDTLVVSHFHRTSSHVEPTGVKQRLVVNRSIGCLCQLRPSYQMLTNWNHGFATVEPDGKSGWLFENFLINGKEVIQV